MSRLDDPPDGVFTQRYRALYSNHTGVGVAVEENEQVQQLAEPPSQPADMPPPGSRTAWWRKTAVVVPAGAVVVVAALAIGILVGRGGDRQPTVAPPGPAQSSGAPSISMHGQISLAPFDAIDSTTGTAISLHDGDPCTATAGFSDIAEGTAVNIGGSTGQTLGVGALGAGVLRDNGSGILVCQFAFQALVPGGQSIYTVTISHRGTQTFTPDQVAAGISLTLG